MRVAANYSAPKNEYANFFCASSQESQEILPTFRLISEIRVYPQSGAYFLSGIFNRRLGVKPTHEGQRFRPFFKELLSIPILLSERITYHGQKISAWL